MTNSTPNIPFFRSFILGRTVYMTEVKDLSDEELDMLNVETQAALVESRRKYDNLDDKSGPEARAEYMRGKLVGCLQIAIQQELDRD
jgi:hypothetical protein